MNSETMYLPQKYFLSKYVKKNKFIYPYIFYLMSFQRGFKKPRIIA